MFFKFHPYINPLTKLCGNIAVYIIHFKTILMIFFIFISTNQIFAAKLILRREHYVRCKIKCHFVI